MLAAAGLLGLARLGHDPLAAIRNLAGFTRLALITATLISAPLSGITPLAYVMFCSGAIDIQTVNLWSWPALPSRNHTASLIRAAAPRRRRHRHHPLRRDSQPTPT